jgi:hypothetical protein
MRPRVDEQTEIARVADDAVDSTSHELRAGLDGDQPAESPTETKTGHRRSAPRAANRTTPNPSTSAIMRSAHHPTAASASNPGRARRLWSPSIDWALFPPARIAGLVLLNTYYCEMPTLRSPEAIWLFSTPAVRNIARPVSRMFGHWIFRRMYQWQVGKCFRGRGSQR